MDTGASTVSDWLSSPGLAPSVGPSEGGDDDTQVVVESDNCYTGCELYMFVNSTLIIGMLCVLGLVGNTASFVVFVKDSVKTSTLFLFQSLCVIDSLLLITVFPLYCFEPFICYTGLYTSYLSNGHYLVNMYVFPLASVSQTATIWVTVLVGINRYIAVCKPYQAARLCTVRQAKLQLTVVLVFAVLYNVTRFGELYPEFVTTANGTYIQPRLTELGRNRLYIFIYDSILYMIFMLILPLFVLAVLNIRLVKALKKLRRKRAEMQSATQRQDNNVTLVLIIVIIVFITCQTPALANRFMWSVLDDRARDCGGFQFYFSRLSNTLVITNSSVNFLIYLLFNTRFKQILVKGVVCRCCCCCRSSKMQEGGGGQQHQHQHQSYSVIRSSQTATSNSTNHNQQQQHPARRIRESPENQTGVTF